MITRENHKFRDNHCPIICKRYVIPPNTSLGTDAGNWHEDLELLVFTGGKGILSYGCENIVTASGDIVIVNPNVIHTIVTQDSSVEYICLIIGTSFCNDNFVDMNSTRFVNYLQDSHLTALVEELHGVFQRSTTNSNDIDKASCSDIEQLMIKRSLLLQILTHIFCNYRLSEANAPYNASTRECRKEIRDALEFAYRESHREISIDEVADLVQMSKFHFSREFKKATQQSFVSYLNLIRCEKAAILLLNPGISISTICSTCGFSSQTYFSRVFLRTMGESPMKFRKKNCKK